MDAKKFVSSLQFVVIAVLILRLFFAYEWMTSGYEKIVQIMENPQKYFSGLQVVLSKTWVEGSSTTPANPYPFMADFLKNTVAPNTAAFITLDAVAEFSVGILFLSGFLVRPAAVIAIIMNIIFFLAAGHTSVSTAGTNFIMIGGEIFMLLVSAGRAYGIDGFLSRKFPKIKLF